MCMNTQILSNWGGDVGKWFWLSRMQSKWSAFTWHNSVCVVFLRICVKLSPSSRWLLWSSGLCNRQWYFCVLGSGEQMYMGTWQKLAAPYSSTSVSHTPSHLICVMSSSNVLFRRNCSNFSWFSSKNLTMFLETFLCLSWVYPKWIKVLWKSSSHQPVSAFFSSLAHVDTSQD